MDLGPADARPLAATSDRPTEPPGPDETIERILKQAQRHYKLADEAWQDNRDEAAKDAAYKVGDGYWDPAYKATREMEGRPCLTINRIQQPIKMLVNAQRQSNPSLNVLPVDEKADKRTAEIYQGLIRHIEANSEAEAAQDHAYEQAVTGGFGFFRVLTQFVDDEKGWEQELAVSRILDPNAVYYDPNCRQFDGSDATFALVVEDIPRDEFESMYGEEEQKNFQDSAFVIKDWKSKDTVRVAEYFWTEFERRVVVQVLGPDGPLDMDAEQLPEGETPIRERVVTRKTIWWAKITGATVIEMQRWPGRYIPIIPVWGDENVVRGQRVLQGLVRQARDPLSMYSYWVSAETEQIALAPRAPFVGAVGQFEGRNEWLTANTKNHAVLQYHPADVNGQLVPPPQRNQAEPPIQAMVMAIAQADNDLKATTSTWDPSLGVPGPEQSGRAITARQRQGDLANFHFADNLSRALRHYGRVLIDLIPKVYNQPRTVRILGEDGTAQTVPINQEFDDNGIMRAYDLRAGRYDVRVVMGPAYTTRQQEQADAMVSLVQANPGLMQVAGDLLVESMNWPGSQRLADRLKRALPPPLQDPPDEQDIPPAIAQQMQQLQQHAEMLAQELQRMQRTIETKELEIASKEKIAISQQQTQMAVAEIQANASLGLQTMKEQQAVLEQWFNRLAAMEDRAGGQMT